MGWLTGLEDVTSDPHARTTVGWSGRRAAWFVVVGYATVLFNFTAVNLLLPGLHSYSGL